MGTSALLLLIQILNSTSRVEKEYYCVSLLLSLCINGGVKVISMLQNSPSLMAFLYSLLRDDNSRANKKASSLISILHQFYSPHSIGRLQWRRKAGFVLIFLGGGVTRFHNFRRTTTCAHILL
ncbi:hypothetical protein NE237_011370 [Protea cynaroides]|uniref:Uncharacterized protein n=1 Tax=Protea cynaroides TaxID=273540 RepID=A0A9Q0JWZ2_9MAGN|nr:hypothetical protein NE237_011370 [Protea cynaroides]